MSRTLIDRGAGCWNLELAPGVVVELAKEPRGWQFWQLSIDGERLGSRSSVPPKLVEVLDSMAAPSHGRQRDDG